MEIGQKLKTKRTEAGLSQEALAERIGVSRQTISSWENNRSYPDIGSILKLSDLYDVSLDELLKEDENMRKHVEETAKLPQKTWNLLFELAILLLPFGALAAYWGASWLGLGMQIVGLGMLPALWILRWKLFGMSLEDRNNSLLGWALYVGGSLLRFVSGDSLLLALGGNILSIIGLLMIYSHGVYLERGTRFWLVIALYVGIPLYILGSAAVGQLGKLGAFSAVQPFGSDYRVEAVLYGGEETALPVVDLEDSLGNRMYLGSERIGAFQYVEPSENQTEKGIWQLIPEEDSEELYKLVMDENGVLTLSYLVDDQLQWRWRLTKLETVSIKVAGESTLYTEMDWYYSWEEIDPEMQVSGWAGSVSFLCSIADLTELTVIEEYHHDGQTERQEYTLTRGENQAFTPELPLEKRYDSGEQYVIYYIGLNGGVYAERINLQ